MVLGLFPWLIKTYFRTTLVGEGNIPKHGPMLVVANHSGFAGADAIVLARVLKDRGYSTRILAHWTYFTFPKIAKFCNEHGLRSTSVNNAVKQLEHGHAVIIFPEGEVGNFKSFKYRYQLQEFHTGVVRIALKANVPIVPVAIIGAEESHINLGNFDVKTVNKKLHLPIPINLFPLPAKWVIRFGRPVMMPKEINANNPDSREVYALTSSIQNKIQNMIFEGLQERQFVFSRKFDTLLKRAKVLSKLVEPPECLIVKDKK